MYMPTYMLRNIALQLVINECRQETKVEQRMVGIRKIKKILKNKIIKIIKKYKICRI
jgi:hypothetical protein